jgi:4-amino-4-deoxy-L-arabinose transferase-like glycosyltransferase
MTGTEPNSTHSKGIHRAFVLFTAAISAILLLPDLLKEGLFVDGLLYSTLAHNLATGQGTFWFPSLSETIYAAFHEHPPLAFGIQSLIYRIFGDGFYLDKIYSLLTYIGTATLIALLWRRLPIAAQYVRMYWLPVLFFTIMPVAHWSYKSNMLENTMGLFSLYAVFLIYISIKQRGAKKLSLIVLSASLICCAFFSKGFPGLYPLAFFFLYWLVFLREYPFRRMVVDSVLLLLCTGLSFTLLFALSDGAYAGTWAYIETQVLSSLEGKRIVVESRWHIMWALFIQLVVLIVLVAILLIARFKSAVIQKAFRKPESQYFLLFALVGLSASAPIMVSPKQLSFYIMPALPVFSIAFAVISAPAVSDFLQKIRIRSIGFRLFQVVGIGLLATALVLCVVGFGTYGRNKAELHDIDIIGELLQPGITISASPGLNDDWGAVSYFQRKFDINLERSVGNNLHLLMMTGEELPENFTEVELELKKYKLAIHQ